MLSKGPQRKYQGRGAESLALHISEFVSVKYFLLLLLELPFPVVANMFLRPLRPHSYFRYMKDMPLFK